MSWGVSLFVDSAPSLEQVAAELGSLLGVSFQRFVKNGQSFYEYLGDGFRANLLKHDLDNDGDLKFAEYRYQLVVWAQSNWDWEKAREASLQFTQRAFAVFKQTHRYRLLLVKELQDRLDIFSPEELPH